MRERSSADLVVSSSVSPVNVALKKPTKKTSISDDDSTRGFLRASALKKFDTPTINLKTKVIPAILLAETKPRDFEPEADSAYEMMDRKPKGPATTIALITPNDRKRTSSHRYKKVGKAQEHGIDGSIGESSMSRKQSEFGRFFSRLSGDDSVMDGRKPSGISKIFGGPLTGPNNEPNLRGRCTLLVIMRVIIFVVCAFVLLFPTKLAQGKVERDEDFCYIPVYMVVPD